MKPIQFKLYITGKTYRSERAVETLHKICDSLGTKAQMNVIDILEEPEKAEEDKILATPTLLKISPPGSRRIIGDLSDVQKVLQGLDIEDLLEKEIQGDIHGNRED